MLKKLIAIAFLLVIANQGVSYAEVTPLQQKVRSIFTQIKNNQQEEKTVYHQEGTVVDKVQYIEAVPANDEQDTNNIVAADQEQEDEEVYENESNEIVVTTPKTNYVKDDDEKDDAKTAAEAYSKDRTAKINKKWSIEALGWNTELTGHVAVADNENLLAQAGANARIDLENDTSLDKKKVPGFKLAYNNGGRSSVEFNYAKIDQDGNLNVGIQREFKGKIYGAAGTANFEINNTMFDLLWKYRFSHNVEESGREKSYVAGLLGVKASKMEFTFDGQATIAGAGAGPAAPAQQYHEDENETIPVPYIGVEAGTYLSDNLYLKGYIRYLKLNNVKDYDAEHADYDISLSYKLSNKDGNQDIFFDVGYRQISYDVEGDGKDVELKYKGPYFGLEFQF